MNDFNFEEKYKKTIAENGFREEKLKSLPKKRLYYIVKRIFDIVVSVIGIIIALIPSLIIAVIIKISTHGPVFYLQERLGKDKKPFKIIKFRTMQEESGVPVWAEEDDPRITKTGRILRKTHLDEIPQLINILKGDMSIVGPRPEREYFYKEFSEYIEGFEQRMLVPQGLTGFAQLTGVYDLAPEKKIIYDLYYIKYAGIIFDFVIILKTAAMIIFKRKKDQKTEGRSIL